MGATNHARAEKKSKYAAKIVDWGHANEEEEIFNGPNTGINFDQYTLKKKKLILVCVFFHFYSKQV